MVAKRTTARHDRLSTKDIADALTAATKRRNGLWLKATRVGSVDVKAFTMLIKHEDILAKRKSGRLVLTVGGHELRVCGGNRAEAPLHKWCHMALTAQEPGKKAKVLYANPKLFFDLY